MIEQGTKKTSVYLLILANVVVITMAILDNWSFGNMLWIYWCQSVIIGIFHFFRLLFFKGLILPELKNSAGFNINDRLNKMAFVGPSSSVFAALFFAVHYGFFHYGYATFLGLFFGADLFSTFSVIWPAVLIFTLNHFLSLIFSLLDKEETKSLGELFSEPYSRILPMHLMIMIYGFLLGSFGGFVALPWGQAITAGQLPQIIGIIIFSILKIYADVAGHNKKHGLEARPDLLGETKDKLDSREIIAINAKDVKVEDFAKMLNNWADKK